MNYALFSAMKLLLLGLLPDDLNGFVKVEKKLKTRHELEDLLQRPHPKILNKAKALSMMIRVSQ
jgi:hypothetical protein